MKVYVVSDDGQPEHEVGPLAVCTTHLVAAELCKRIHRDGRFTSFLITEMEVLNEHDLRRAEAEALAKNGSGPQ